LRIYEVRRRFTEGQVFPFFFWGDDHLGNANCAKLALQRDSHIIANTEDAMWFGMGDFGDYIAENDRRYKKEHLDREVVGTTGSIIDNTVLSIAAFKEDTIRRCVGVVDGNHERVANEKNNNTNVTVRWLHELDAHQHYCGSSALLRVMFEDSNGHTSWCGINVHHGKRIAKSKSTLLNAYIAKLKYWPDTHVIARGHCHFNGYDQESRVHVNKTWDTLKEEIVFACLTGGYLKGYMEDGGSYVEDMDLDPMDIGFQRMNLMPSRYGMKIQFVSS
jgi:hypothetical protein